MQAAATSPQLHPVDYRRPVFSPQFPGQCFAHLTPRPGAGYDDDANTAQTVNHMLFFIAQDTNSRPVLTAAAQATRGAQGDEAARRIFDWIKSNVEFQEDAVTAALAGLPDPDSAEVLIRPQDLLSMPRPAGDCDDFTMLAVAMLTAAGHPARVKAIEQDERRPDAFSHVYAEAMLGGQWIPFDTSHGDRIGWFAPPTGKVRVWEFRKEGDMQIPTLGAIDWGALINKGVDITGSILIPRLGVPTAPGASVRLPNGTIATNQPTGGMVQFPGLTASATGDSSQTVLLIGGVVVALGLVVALSKKG